MTASLRHPIHRGSAVAHGVFVDARALGEDVARRRVVDLSDGTSEVHRCGDHLIVLFREPIRLLAGAGPGGLLVRQGDVLSSAPLEKAAIASLGGPDPAVVLVLGGTPQRQALDSSTRQDPAAWIDVSDFEVEPGVEPLGHVERSPAPRLGPVAVDVRGTLGIAGEAPGAEAVRAALFAQGAAEDRPGWWRSLFGGGARSGGGGGGFSGSLGGSGGNSIGASEHASEAPSGPPPRFVVWLAGMAGGLFGAIAAVLSMVLPAGSPDDDRDDELVKEASRRRFGARGGGGRGRALAVRDASPSQGESPLASLTRGLRIWAARFLMWSRLAQHVGRRQAEYLSRMVEMFDQDDLDAALRHAIALGDGTAPAAPALGTPSARADLAISLGRGGAATAMFGTGALLDDLRRLYRRAFDQLVKKGEIDKAAFVLAELLHENEEAVSFLEKHGRLRLAAEIAEARKLPPGLVVRQWFLAKDPARAVALARAHGAFADAVSRLEASGKTAEAASLKVLWADSLASAGDYAAAIDVIWPVEGARSLAIGWFDRAIAIGGTVAARMAIRKLRLVPTAFDEVRDLAIGLLRQPGEDGLANARAFAREIARAAADAPLRALAKPVARALLRSRDREDARLSASAVTATGDAAFQAEVRRMRARRNAPAEPAVARIEGDRLASADEAARDAPPFDDGATPLDIPLSARPTPVEIRIAAGDTGALPLFDAAELPDGRLLVALGEAGSRIVSRDGETLTRFSEPAHRIVISDHGDRALVLAPRGASWRIARLDLTRRRQQPWCDARIGPFAPDFDGSLWYVASGGALHAIDVTVDGWEHLWSLAENTASLRCIARSPERLSALFEVGLPRTLEVWPFDLPSHRHRARVTIAPAPRATRASQVDVAVAPAGAVAVLEAYEGTTSCIASLHDPRGRSVLPLVVPQAEHGFTISDEWLISASLHPTSTELQLVHTASRAVRARVVLEGRELRARARITGDRLLVVDARGRLLVLSLRTGRVVRDLRLA